MADVSISIPLAGCFVPQNFTASGTSDAQPTVVMEKEGQPNKTADVVQTGTIWLATFTNVPAGPDWTLVATLNNDEAAESNITVFAPSPITIFPLTFISGSTAPELAKSKSKSNSKSKQKALVTLAAGTTINVSARSATANLVLVTIFIKSNRDLLLLVSDEAAPPNENEPNWTFSFTGNFRTTDKFVVHVEAFAKNGKILGRAIRRRK